MRILIATLAYLLATVLPLSFLGASPDIEKRNRQVVEDGLYLCQVSHCERCGSFSYLSEEVFYHPSKCESLFEVEQDEIRHRKEDQEIRAKYGPDAGAFDAGVDAGR